MLKPLLAATCLLLLSTAALAEPAPASLSPLLETINQRIAIADQVALTKWDSGKPIQDSPREQQVIANAEKLAPTYKLAPEEIGQFLAAQIEANKLVQYALLSQWNIQGKAPNSPRPDLANDIRPKLDQIQIKLLERYAAFSPLRSNPSCQTWLAQAIQNISNDKTHTLALIRATGELCIAKPHP
ncbi:MAG: chorismate mutase [Pseudomonas sp.]|nr:chorismate mutase [Pseudomonas sp.]